MRWQSFGFVTLFTLLASNSPVTAQPQVDPYRAQNEVRLTRIENDVRKLTGSYEEAMYGLTQLNQRLEKQLEDMQLRIDTLEKQLSARGGSPDAGSPPETADAGMGGSSMGSSEMSSGPRQAPPHRVGDTLGGQLDSPGGTPAPPRGTPEETPEQYLEGDTPDAQFNYAFSLLRRDDFPGAEAAFRAFLALNPEHRAAPNAKYWLGKTYFAQKNYTEAARVLLDGYQQFANSDKGPDMVLTLGLSLKELDQKEQACATFDELIRRYPKAPPAIKQKAVAAQQSTGCN